jgi:hypothetical protein
MLLVVHDAPLHQRARHLSHLGVLSAKVQPGVKTNFRCSTSTNFNCWFIIRVDHDLGLIAGFFFDLIAAPLFFSNAKALVLPMASEP